MKSFKVGYTGFAVTDVLLLTDPKTKARRIRHFCPTA